MEARTPENFAEAPSTHANPKFPSSVHEAVHNPTDRRLAIVIGRKYLAGAAIVGLTVIGLAWLYYLLYGLPSLPLEKPILDASTNAYGFPAWIRLSHFVNFIFLSLLVRSGLSILFDHPRLYWNDHCSPNSEWMRFTPIEVPTDRLWTAKDDARYLPPILGLPGFRHTIGRARSWHFLSVYAFLLNGLIFAALLFLTDHWQRLVPTSLDIFVQAWDVFVYYATFHMPLEPDGFYSFNPLQQLSYFFIIFIAAPLSLLTGLAMSPGLVNRFPWYAKLFGGRQSARSLHFLLLLSYLAFLVVHVTMVAMTGFVQNMNHITLGTDDPQDMTGIFVGALGLAAVVGIWMLTHYIAWDKPRLVQRVYEAVNGPFLRLLGSLGNREKYTTKDISAYHWPNGKMPTSDTWRELAHNDFANYRLKVCGLVETPMDLSLDDLRQLGKTEHISMHHCIQGWSGLAQWGGISLARLLEHVKPKPEAKAIALYSYGDALYGGTYYETQIIEFALKGEAMLAYEMNGEALPVTYGAPLRLRVENQLGYKMIKWIERIEFIESEKLVGDGQGGSNGDHEFFDRVPTI